MCVEDVFFARLRYKNQAVQHRRENLWNVVKANLSVQEGCDGFLVGCIEPAGDIPAPANGIVGERKAGETLKVGLLETQAAQLGKIQLPVAYGKSLGEGEGQSNRLSHIGMPKLGHHRPVGKFDH